MAEAALSFAVQKLGDLLIQKLKFLRGVKDQVIWLKDELQMMQSFLKDASKKQATDERIRMWVSDIRCLALDAEDVIEAFDLKVDSTPKKSLGLVGRCAVFPSHVNHLNKLGQEIGSIRNRLQAIKSRQITYGIQSLDSEPGPSKKKVVVERRRQVFPWHTNKYLVGLEGDIKSLLQRAIFVGKDGLFIASIVGMGGIGKSTLAKEVYNQAKVQFECHVWVTASQDFKPKKLLKKMLEQLLGNNDDEIKMRMKEASAQKLMEMVNRHLIGKRYLAVVDDVWDSDDWDFLAKVFPNDQDKPSRLLITSRNKKIISRDGYVHDMKVLDPDRSWQLFLKASLRDEDDGKCPPRLESIGREILEKCEGLPLAIIVMGGLLLEHGQNVSGWENIKKRITSHVLASENSVMAVLELSYVDLPPHLQTCFLCFSFFSENHDIWTEELIQTWIAEGIVPHEGEQTMEEIAWSYLDELINRNMVEAQYHLNDERVAWYHIHDLLFDLCISKAKEEIKFGIVKEEDSHGDLVKTRHLSIYHSSEKFMSMRCPNPHVRTLFFHNLDRINSGENGSCTYNHWKSFEGLRVLYLWEVGLQEVSKTIGTMIGLRYLNLSWNKISKLPKSLGHLRNLQSLNIAGNEHVKVPNVLWKLDNLRHLMMPLNITCKKALKLDTLTNLQTLKSVSTQNIVIEQLEELINLRELNVFLDSDADASKLLNTLGTLKNLNTLVLQWNRGHVLLDGIVNLKHVTCLTFEGPQKELPNNFPDSLMHLWLIETKLENDPMVVLEKLPELSSLVIEENAYICEEMTIRDNGFPSLRSLSFRYMPELKILHLGRNAMPKLNKLRIHSCPEIEILPKKEELRLMENLQVLEIIGTSKDTASKIRSEEYATIISRIPSVQISLIEPSD